MLNNLSRGKYTIYFYLGTNKILDDGKKIDFVLIVSKFQSVIVIARSHRVVKKRAFL
jgi:hypothetical protein